MKYSFKQKVFFSFVIIFLLFVVGVALFEQQRERKFKTDALEEKLNAYADMTDKVLTAQSSVDSLLALFPHNIRLSVIDRTGKVLFDNRIADVAGMENHAERPEIVAAAADGSGSAIRTSASDTHEYLYYAKRFNNRFVRVALPYNIELKDFVKADNLFLYYIGALFVLMLMLIHYAANRFGKSIDKLKEFTDVLESGELRNPQFPQDELGEIGKRIADNYRRLKESENTIILEREKLLQHVHSSEEGLCFFSANRAVEFYNGLFIQYLNTIADEANSNPSSLFSETAFEAVNAFLAQHEKHEAYFETKIRRQGKTFAIRLNIFDDNSFEIIINDISQQEKTRLLKQEMTGNIAHELRTPITGIRGCLETVLEQQLSAEKEGFFIRSAYEQVLKLSELIQDMSLITKIEDAPQSFHREMVGLSDLLETVRNDFADALKEKNVAMTWEIGNATVAGNRTLLYSIFRNLTDNAIRYAGEGVQIGIKKYNEDSDFYYLSFADTGVGVPEEHLTRLFERFYRADEGRTRDTGGSGLGLSIVKNAVLFHKGTIVAKNRVGGGIEFLLSLPKR